MYHIIHDVESERLKIDNFEESAKRKFWTDHIVSILTAKLIYIVHKFPAWIQQRLSEITENFPAYRTSALKMKQKEDPHP